MQKKITIIVLSVIIFLSCVLVAHNIRIDSAKVISDINNLNSPKYKLGVVQGAASMFAADKYFPQSKIKIFTNEYDAYIELKDNKVDAILDSELSAEYVVNKNNGLAVYPVSLESLDIVAAVKQDNYELLRSVNDFITSISTDGTYSQLMYYWLSDKSGKKLPNLSSEKKQLGKLVVGTNGMIEPYSYISENGQLVGSDIELAKRFANSINKDVEFVTMSFNELIPALQAGKVDVIFSNLYATPERQSAVLLSKPYLQTQLVAVVDKKRIKNASKIKTLRDLKYKRAGVLTGAVFDKILFRKVPEAKPVYYSSIPDVLTALEQRKIDVAILDEPLARNIKVQTNKIEIINPALSKEEYGWVLSKKRPELKKELDNVLKEFQKDGTIQQLDSIWFGSDESKKVLPAKLGDARRGTLKLATNSGCVPFAYMKNNRIVGFEIALLHLVCQKIGYGLEVSDMDFVSLVPSVISGKMDLAGSMISITEERKKAVAFSEPIYKGGVVAAIKSSHVNSEDDTFLQNFKRGFYRTFIEENSYKLVLSGLKITLIISAFSILIGTIFGFIICFFRRSKNKFLYVPAKIYIIVVQGIPILVFMMVLYYVVFAKVQVNAIYVACVAFGMDFAAYAAEIFRSGLDAIDKGQKEAARSMGFNRFQTFIYITFPQALKHIIPVYKGEVISTVKITSIVGYIAIQDLTKISDIIRSRTYEAFFPLISTAMIYFILAFIIAKVLNFCEFKINPLNRKRMVNGIEVTK